LAFLTARQSVEEFRRRMPTMSTVWIPEATSPMDYRNDIPLRDRTIDVLELGRKFPRYHDAIVTRLSVLNRVHRYELTQGRLLFPNRAALVEGLAASKVSVCFPASMTHPEYAGDVETTTHRYFESLASKCVILGHAPQELVDLFGYNPVIEADLERPELQLESILENVSDYQRLVDDNYDRFLKVGTWECRANSIVEQLELFGYKL
jgi:hypothetical protein